MRTPALFCCLLLAAGAAQAAGTDPAAGYVPYHTLQGDFDGDGAEETATAIQWKEPALDHPPHLKIMRGETVLLDLWLKDTNALSPGNAVKHEALQVGDLSGDGAPELLFLPSSAGGSGGTQVLRVVHWNGRSWSNLRVTHRAFKSLNENDGAVFRSAEGGRSVLYLYQLSLPDNHYRAQRFTYVRGGLEGGVVTTARKRGKAGLAELGL